MTDLVDVVNFIMDDSNEGKVKQIIQNVHEWCRKTFLRKNIAKDMLDILVQYSDMLDAQDKNWRNSLQNIDLHSEISDLVEFDGEIPNLEKIIQNLDGKK